MCVSGVPKTTPAMFYYSERTQSTISKGEGTGWSPEEAGASPQFSLRSRHRVCLIPPPELWWPVCHVCPESSLGTQCPECLGGRSFRHLCLAHTKFQTPRGKQRFSVNYIVQTARAQWPGLTSPGNGGSHSEIQVPSCPLRTSGKQAFLRMAVPDSQHLPPPWSPWSAKPPSSLNILD